MSAELTLKYFILRQKTINLYRHTIRATRCKFNNKFQMTVLIVPLIAIPHSAARRETMAWVRREFERNKNLSDVVCVRLGS